MVYQRKGMKRIVFKDFINGFFNDDKKINNDLSSWENEELKNGNYESWNFEEEELEEDDYYYEDDKD